MSNKREMTFEEILKQATEASINNGTQYEFIYEGVRVKVEPAHTLVAATALKNTVDSLTMRDTDNRYVQLTRDITLKGIKITPNDILHTGYSAWPHQSNVVPIWTTADGRSILVIEMTEDHLLNAIRWIQQRLPYFLKEEQILASHGLQIELTGINRRAMHYKFWLKRFKTELYRRHVRGLLSK